MIELAQAVSIADSDIRGELYGLSGEFAGEVSARILADQVLSAAFKEYADGSRHYDLFTMDMASQMPIKAKEFAVNILLNYDLPDGFVVDSHEGRNQLVGSVEDYDESDGSCRFTAYADARYTVVDHDGVKSFPYADILGINAYEFDGVDQQKRTCADSLH